MVIENVCTKNYQLGIESGVNTHTKFENFVNENNGHREVHDNHPFVLFRKYKRGGKERKPCRDIPEDNFLQNQKGINWGCQGKCGRKAVQDKRIERLTRVKGATPKMLARGGM